MKTASFYRVCAIRQQRRAGRSVAALAATFGLERIVVEKIVACRTREAAAQVLDTQDTLGIVRRFVVSEGRMVEFTTLFNDRE